MSLSFFQNNNLKASLDYAPIALIGLVFITEFDKCHDKIVHDISKYAIILLLLGILYFLLLYFKIRKWIAFLFIFLLWFTLIYIKRSYINHS
jgi:hypothetical protein